MTEFSGNGSTALRARRVTSRKNKKNYKDGAVRATSGYGRSRSRTLKTYFARLGLVGPERYRTRYYVHFFAAETIRGPHLYRYAGARVCPPPPRANCGRTNVRCRTVVRRRGPSDPTTRARIPPIAITRHCSGPSNCLGNHYWTGVCVSSG